MGLPLGGPAEAELGVARGVPSGAGHRRQSREAAGEIRVGVDPAVAQEGPAAARLLALAQIAVRQEERGGVARCALDDAAEGVGDERLSVEADARVGTGQALLADAVDRGDEDPVRDRVGALDGLPGVVLDGVLVRALVELPADRGRIGEQVGAGERRRPRGLGKPLVPADQHADARRSGSRGPGSRGRPA